MAEKTLAKIRCELLKQKGCEAVTERPDNPHSWCPYWEDGECWYDRETPIDESQPGTGGGEEE